MGRRIGNKKEGWLMGVETVVRMKVIRGSVGMGSGEDKAGKHNKAFQFIFSGFCWGLHPCSALSYGASYSKELLGSH